MRELILLLTVLVACVRPAAAADLPAKKNFHVFLLIGQSNMAGRGKVDPADNAPHPRVLMYTKEGEWKPAVDPLHFDKPKVVGVGPGRTFANAVAEVFPDITIGLIPCAVGGSPISFWQPGAEHKSTGSHPWDDAIRRAKAALKDGTLKGILWHQGESDSKPSAAEVYEEKLHELITRLREELNAPNVPFIAGQMGIFKERPWSDAKKLVDRAHRELPGKIAATGFAGSDGLAHKGDSLHFGTAGARELGRRYFEAWHKVAPKR